MTERLDPRHFPFTISHVKTTSILRTLIRQQGHSPTSKTVEVVAMVSVERLHYDVLGLIFARLQINDLFAVALVCRSFHHAAIPKL